MAEDSEVDISLLPEGETVKKIEEEEEELEAPQEGQEIEESNRPFRRNPFDIFGNGPFFRPFGNKIPMTCA